ncbi:periplasmic binding protein-like II [Neocallimastix sp. 'constans']
MSKIINLYIWIILCFINKIYGKNITLNVVAYATEDYSNIYKTMINDFNEYSIKKELDIYVDLTVISNSDSYESYASMVQALLMKKNNNKYDLYYYDNAYTQEYGPYLLDLEKYLPKDHIDMFNSKLLSQSCIYENKLVGLPYTTAYTLLYSNTKLLKKYNKRIPKTWDELIETSKYIMERENDPELIAYNGLFDESENGICSIYEFIYSCRNSTDSPFPDITSETTINALNLMKKLKKEIASDDIFQSDLFFGLKLLLEGKGIFVKFWTLDYNSLETLSYKTSVLPGIKEGISGSVVAGYNLGITNNISPEKLEASIIAIKYLTSKELLKKIFLIENILAGIDSLYDDEDICKKIDCETMKNIQPIHRPYSKYYEIKFYNQKISNFVLQFLYKNEEASEVLEKIRDLTRIHYISVIDNDAYKSLIMVIFVMTHILFYMILFSLILLFFKKFDAKFQYLSKDSWIISIIGLAMVLSSIFTLYGTVTEIKCQLYFILIVIGNTLNLIPVFHKFIVDFPETNKISMYFKKHKYYFFLGFFMCDLIFVLLHFLSDYKVSTFIIEDGKNYRECNVIGKFGFSVVIIIIIHYLLIICVMLILSYIEWNQNFVMFNVRMMVYAIYSDVLSVILLFILKFISFNNYFYKFIIQSVLLLLSVVISYISMYGIRIFLNLNELKNTELNIDCVINNSFRRRIDSISRTESQLNYSEYIDKKSSIILKIRNYHIGNSISTLSNENSIIRVKNINESMVSNVSNASVK